MIPRSPPMLIYHHPSGACAKMMYCAHKSFSRRRVDHFPAPVVMSCMSFSLALGSISYSTSRIQGRDALSGSLYSVMGPPIFCASSGECLLDRKVGGEASVPAGLVHHRSKARNHSNYYKAWFRPSKGASEGICPTATYSTIMHSTSDIA